MRLILARSTVTRGIKGYKGLRGTLVIKLYVSSVCKSIWWFPKCIFTQTDNGPFDFYVGVQRNIDTPVNANVNRYILSNEIIT